MFDKPICFSNQGWWFMILILISYIQHVYNSISYVSYCKIISVTAMNWQFGLYIGQYKITSSDYKDICCRLVKKDLFPLWILRFLISPKWDFLERLISYVSTGDGEWSRLVTHTSTFSEREYFKNLTLAEKTFSVNYGLFS